MSPQRDPRHAGLTSLTLRALNLAADAVERTPVNPRSLLPAYLQLSLSLASSIIGRQMPGGAQLPSEPELERRYGVSRDTARNAVRALREIGVVETRRGVGHFVTATPEVAEVTLRPGARVVVRLPAPGEPESFVVFDVIEPDREPRAYSSRTVLVVPD